MTFVAIVTKIRGLSYQLMQYHMKEIILHLDAKIEVNQTNILEDTEFLIHTVL